MMTEIEGWEEEEGGRGEAQERRWSCRFSEVGQKREEEDEKEKEEKESESDGDREKRGRGKRRRGLRATRKMTFLSLLIYPCHGNEQ